MLMDKINVGEWFCTKSPSLARYKEGDLPLLNFSNLTCMYLSVIALAMINPNAYKHNQNAHMKSLILHPAKNETRGETFHSQPHIGDHLLSSVCAHEIIKSFAHLATVD